MKWLTRNIETIIPLLVVVLATLVLAVAFRYELLTASLLEANKEALSALGDVVTVVAVMIGGVFSYYRFFRGRTFSRRAELSLSVSVLPTTDTYNIHAVTLEVKNIGSMAIWEPVPVFQVYEFGPGGLRQETWDGWQEAHAPGGDADTISVVDSGETATFINHNEINKSVWAVAYVAFVRSYGRETWKCAVTISNTLETKNTEKHAS